MMRVIVLALLISSSAFASQFIGGAGAVVTYNTSTSGRQYDAQTPLSVRVGWRFDFADVFAEYSFVQKQTGTDQISIGSSNQEFIAWIRKGDPTARTFVPFIALGAGAHYQITSTRFESQTQTEPGIFEPLAAADAGLEVRFSHAVELSIEGRATTAAGYAPNPLFGLASYLNLLF